MKGLTTAKQVNKTINLLNLIIKKFWWITTLPPNKIHTCNFMTTSIKSNTCQAMWYPTSRCRQVSQYTAASSNPVPVLPDPVPYLLLDPVSVPLLDPVPVLHFYHFYEKVVQLLYG